jgi:hypothetical protein
MLLQQDAPQAARGGEAAVMRTAPDAMAHTAGNA